VAGEAKVSLELEVTGNAEAKLKKIAGAVQDLEKTGNSSFANFGASAEKSFDVAKKVAVTFGSVAAVVAGELWVLKEALDLTMEAETVRAINAQFELLATSAGIAGEELKNGLVAASDGLIDDTDLIQLANKAIIQMGASAAQLPPVMELARKATSVFGGELADNFEKINSAISTGNTRAVRSLGIIVDSEKAYRDFASSIGTSADSLSEAGRQQAILNAVLNEGKTSFSGVNVNLKENTDTFQRLRVTLQQIGETATLAFEKLAGPAVRAFLGGLSAMASDAKRSLQANFGEGAEKANAALDRITEKVNGTKAAIIDLDRVMIKNRGGDPFVARDRAREMAGLNAELKTQSIELAKAQAEAEKFTVKQEKGTASTKGGTAALIDKSRAMRALADEGQKVAERLAGEDPAAKYEKDLVAFTAAVDAKRNIDFTFEEGKALLEAERDAKVAEKRASEIADLMARNELMISIDKEKYAREITENQGAIERKLAQERAGSAARLKYEQAETQRKDKENKEREQNFKSSLGTISTLMQSGNAELFRLGQAAAIAQATMDGYAAVQKALTAAPPPFNFALAALVGTASAVNIGKIANAQPPKFADGGIVPGNSMVGDKVPVLANSGEVILNSAQQRRLLSVADGERGGGGQAAILEQIRDRLDRLQPQVAVTLDGREIFNSIRNQLGGGRAFT